MEVRFGLWHACRWRRVRRGSMRSRRTLTSRWSWWRSRRRLSNAVLWATSTRSSNRSSRFSAALTTAGRTLSVTTCRWTSVSLSCPRVSDARAKDTTGPLIRQLSSCLKRGRSDVDLVDSAGSARPWSRRLRCSAPWDQQQQRLWRRSVDIHRRASARAPALTTFFQEETLVQVRGSVHRWVSRQEAASAVQMVRLCLSTAPNWRVPPACTRHRESGPEVTARKLPGSLPSTPTAWRDAATRQHHITSISNKLPPPLPLQPLLLLNTSSTQPPEVTSTPQRIRTTQAAEVVCRRPGCTVVMGRLGTTTTAAPRLLPRRRLWHIRASSRDKRLQGATAGRRRPTSTVSCRQLCTAITTNITWLLEDPLPVGTRRRRRRRRSHRRHRLTIGSLHCRSNNSRSVQRQTAAPALPHTAGHRAQRRVGGRLVELEWWALDAWFMAATATRQHPAAVQRMSATAETHWPVQLYHSQTQRFH